MFFLPSAKVLILHPNLSQDYCHLLFEIFNLNVINGGIRNHVEHRYEVPYGCLLPFAHPRPLPRSGGNNAIRRFRQIRLEPLMQIAELAWI
jgi:hypothetical protein